jgi:hypothetical protein
MLVTATDVGRNNFQNNAVIAFAFAQRQLWEINVLNFHNSGFDVGHTTIVSHCFVLLNGKYGLVDMVTGTSADRLFMENCGLSFGRGHYNGQRPG